MDKKASVLFRGWRGREGAWVRKTVPLALIPLHQPRRGRLKCQTGVIRGNPAIGKGERERGHFGPTVTVQCV